MLKKASVFLGIFLFLAAGFVGMYFGGTQTMADLCGVPEDERIVSVTVYGEGDGRRRGPSTVYTEGAVYEHYVSLFRDERYHAREIPENSFWLSLDYMISSSQVAYTFETRKRIHLLVSDSYGRESEGKPLPATLITSTDMPREIFLLEAESSIRPDELERLARAGG